jgi:transposase
MQMFFISLFELLDKESKNWRKDTIILMDGAKYHTSGEMMEFYRKNMAPVMFTGPHSYDASPIELFFAAFKSKDINPDRIKTGKR